ncbi:MAG: cation diffusion facilitator family transporter, partial [Pseudomonadota bacterium]
MVHHVAHAAHETHHQHDHAYAPLNFGRIFAFAVILNSIFVLIEATVGWWVNSVALLADAGHNLSDIMGMLLAWGAYWLAQRKPTERYTYGFSNASIFAALLNAMILMLAVGMMLWEAFDRFQNPLPVPGGVVMLVAGVGVLLNGMTALLFIKSQHDLNMKGAYLHMLADAGVSAGVVIGGAVMLLTGWMWID